MSTSLEQKLEKENLATEFMCSKRKQLTSKFSQRQQMSNVGRFNSIKSVCECHDKIINFLHKHVLSVGCILR